MFAWRTYEWMSCVMLRPLSLRTSGLQRMLGLLTHCRCFVPRFATLCAPISDMIRSRKVGWAPDHTHIVKQVLAHIGTNALVHPLPDQPKARN